MKAPLDFSATGWRDALTCRLTDEGMTIVTGMESRQTLLDGAREIVEIRQDATCDPDGIATITSKNERSIAGEFISRAYGLFVASR